LNLDEGVIRVEFTAKHAAEFEVTELPLYSRQLTRDLIENGRVVFSSREFQQFAHVQENAPHLLQISDDTFQRGAFLAKGLGTLGIIPYVAFREFELYLFQAMFAVGKVKDTP
jgi:hypothetical protein